jgi:hypothetical protein
MQQHGLKGTGSRARPWRIFSPKRLPPGLTVSRLGWANAWDEYFPSASWLDHGEVWMKDGRAACVTGQPYILHESARKALALLEQAGAVVRIHEREARRSWHNPGNCYLVEVWRPPSLEARPPTKRTTQPPAGEGHRPCVEARIEARARNGAARARAWRPFRPRAPHGELAVRPAGWADRLWCSATGARRSITCR